MNGNAFSIMTFAESMTLARTLNADDIHWSYTPEPFDDKLHKGAGSSISNDARAIHQFFVIEVHDEEDRYLGPL